MAHILLIDDDHAIRSVLDAMLGQLGHTVVAVGDGREGEAAARREAFDLVITDLIMPEKEGIETIQDLLKRQPKLRIIAMSGGGRGNANDYLPLAKLLGARRTLAKPFTLEELTATVTAVLAEP